MVYKHQKSTFTTSMYNALRGSVKEARLSVDSRGRHYMTHKEERKKTKSIKVIKEFGKKSSRLPPKSAPSVIVDLNYLVEMKQEDVIKESDISKKI